jgi:hypothetical protein
VRPSEPCHLRHTRALAVWLTASSFDLSRCGMGMALQFNRCIQLCLRQACAQARKAAMLACETIRLPSAARGGPAVVAAIASLGLFRHDLGFPWEPVNHLTVAAKTQS